MTSAGSRTKQASVGKDRKAGSLLGSNVAQKYSTARQDRDEDFPK